jgi:hypothetical protein
MTIPKKLAQKWEKKLAKEGLSDIEDSKGRLKSWHSFKFQMQFSPEQFNEIQDYYAKCDNLLHYFTFKRPLDKEIWEYHCQGLGVRSIAKKISKKLDWSTVALIIRRIKKEAGWKV